MIEHGPEKADTSVAVAPDDRRIVSGSANDRTVRVWDAGPGPSSPASADTKARSRAWRSPPRANGVACTHLDENVRFTIFRPKAVRPEAWYPLLAFAHLSEPTRSPRERARPSRGGPKAGRSCPWQAARDFHDSTEDSQQAVPREGEITFVPEIPGFEFNPAPELPLARERPPRGVPVPRSPEMDGKMARGRLTVFLDSIILADVTLSIRVDRQHQPESGPEPHEAGHAQPYRKIFASYSHQDVEIVRQFEWYARTLGDEYLRDWVHSRRRGLERSSPSLDRRGRCISAILVVSFHDFELCKAGMGIRALSGRPHFIRPTYREEPLPGSPQDDLPPETLKRLHFQRIPLRPRGPAEVRARCSYRVQKRSLRLRA